MNASVAPDWVIQVLPVALWAAVIAGLVWLAFVGLDYLNRRDYNLTVADRGGSGGPDPDFLKVDHEKREAARRAGAVFDHKMEDRAEAAAAGEPTPNARKAIGVAKFSTVFFAFASAATVAIGSLGRIEFYDEAARRLSSWDRMAELISTYWLGFLVVAVLIAAQIYHAIRQARAD